MLWLGRSSEKVGSAMKPSSLALLWVARLIEVGIRNWRPGTEPELNQYHNVTSSCDCDCFCHCSSQDFHISSFVLGVLAGGVVVGAGLVVYSLTKVGCRPVVVSDESFGSPRRRGGGFVSLPARSESSCVVC